jgi:hypothetical protein
MATFQQEKHVVLKQGKKKGVFSGVFRTPQQCVDDFVVANSRSDMKRCLMVGGLRRREKTALSFFKKPSFCARPQPVLANATR